MGMKIKLPWEYFTIQDEFNREDPDPRHLATVTTKKIPGMYYIIEESHAEMFYELCRRVVKREAFTEYATEVWEKVFANK